MDIIQTNINTCLLRQILIGDCFVLAGATCMRTTELRVDFGPPVNCVRLTDGQLLSLEWDTKVVPVKVTAKIDSKGVVLVGKTEDS